MNSLISFGGLLRGVHSLALLLALAVQAQAAKVTIDVSDQMPPGLLFVGEKATWKLDIVVEPPQFKQDETEYTFSSLEFIEDKLTPKEKGEGLKITLPAPVKNADKVTYKGAVLETTAFEKVGKREILLKAQATFQATGHADVKVDSKETKLGLEVGALEIVDTLNKDAVIDKKVTTVVGKKIGLKGQIVPAPDPKDVTDPLWTVPGAPPTDLNVPVATVKSYETDKNKGETKGLAKGDLEQDVIAFYWIEGGTGRKVQFQTKYKGRVVKTEAIFDVESPTDVKLTSTITTDSPKTDGIVIDDKYGFSTKGLYLHFGNDVVRGISWGGTVTGPTVSGVKLPLCKL